MILKENEFMYTIPEEEGSCIHSYESNQLAANKPCEDTHTEASFIHQNGIDIYNIQIIIHKFIIRYICIARFCLWHL